jgi:hypothetical protein
MKYETKIPKTKIPSNVCDFPRIRATIDDKSLVGTDIKHVSLKINFIDHSFKVQVLKLFTISSM